MLPLSTTTMRRAQASRSSVRAIFGASLYVITRGVISSITVRQRRGGRGAIVSALPGDLAVQIFKAKRDFAPGQPSRA